VLCRAGDPSIRGELFQRHPPRHTHATSRGGCRVERLNAITRSHFLRREGFVK
jgi:hypothetical protein